MASSETGLSPPAPPPLWLMDFLATHRRLPRMAPLATAPTLWRGSTYRKTEKSLPSFAIREPRGVPRRTAMPTLRRAASAQNGVLTCRSASFSRRACRERRVRFASSSRRGVVARRKRIGRLNPRPTVRGDPSRKTVFAKNARSATARCYAPNERRRPRDAQLHRAIVSLDVNRGRFTVAHVRAGVSTRHRRLEEDRPH